MSFKSDAQRKAVFAMLSRGERLRKRLAKVAGVSKYEVDQIGEFRYTKDRMFLSPQTGLWKKTSEPALGSGGHYHMPTPLSEAGIWVRRTPAKFRAGFNWQNRTPGLARETLKHEIGHNVYELSSPRARRSIEMLLEKDANEISSKEKTYRNMGSTEAFARAYQQYRGKKGFAKSSHRPTGVENKRRAIAIALRSLRGYENS